MENLGSKSDLGTFGFGGGLHSMTSNQGSRCHTSSSDSLAALAAPGRVKMSGRFREFHPDLFWGKGQKNMFSSEKKNTNIIKSNIERQQHISRRHPCFLVASLLCFRDFPQSQKKTQKRLLLLLFAARRMRSWAALMFQLWKQKMEGQKKDGHSQENPEKSRQIIQLEVTQKVPWTGEPTCSAFGSAKHRPTMRNAWRSCFAGSFQPLNSNKLEWWIITE